MRKHHRRTATAMMLFLLGKAAAAAPDDLMIEFAIQNQVMARAAAATGVPPGVRGWERRILYVTGDSTAEYTSGKLKAADGSLVTLRKAYLETPKWSASFDPDSGRGTRTNFPAGHQRVPGGMYASSDAAALMERGHIVQRMGPPLGSRTIAGHRCKLYRPDPAAAQMEFCVAEIGTRKIVVYSRWYEGRTVWTERATSIQAGMTIPAERFRVPATVRAPGAAP